MAMRVTAGLCLLHLCLALLRGVAGSEGKEYNRYDFPKDFIFGASTSAYQVEGAALHDGRKPSIYDTFAHRSKYDTRNPDVACDQYHKYKEDVQLMVETGLDAYRFSISWSRLIPDGRGAVNFKGLRYYNNLINELISHGIEPHVTLVHTDLPQVLENEYGGFLNVRIIEDFTSYVDVCFREFGDRVRHWTTFNEANIFVFGGYDAGNTPPSRCSSPFGFINCTKGNSTTEPYIAAHHILLAHAYAVKLYKENYKAKQRGLVGINLLSYHFAPLTDTREDILACQRAYDFLIGWFMHPLTYGDYPEIMKKNVGNRIPVFTKKESKLLKGSFDFIGVNYYYIQKVKDNSMSLTKTPRDLFADMAVKWIFPNSSASPKEFTFPNEPWGFERVLEYYKDVYANPLIFIHENGQAESYNTAIQDQFRVEYLHDHIGRLLDVVRNGSNTQGYFVWSLLDVYELLFSFDATFGLYYVDYNDPNLTRHPKLSQRWYSQFLKGKNATTNIQMNQAEDTTIGARSSI
ncbi:cyanidin 3-O-glucoside 5-O-glucosyltransferase (acyl-glucose)-like [Chenopodium quinoa]|uniref:cyanidin 3-O-glucoside 5-O-glucosyltransferase (acyl-glucose)-like n=1 Tax=Chenopodium quinoa TaxID=63459 RepID=UPI000B76C767|nr:cyanidin 3-O-glucoside 5-O-glucosyltransferase (acyl-glucose)-like [Chenopodium quinoa]